MSPPRIGVSAVVRVWDGIERSGVNSAYLRAVIAAGGVPVILSHLTGAALAARALEGVDGLLLSGGEDIHPSWYGEAPAEQLWPPSRERDLFELALFAVARQRGLPILGVCRGIQLINVALGGTLYQDLRSQRPGAVDHFPSAGREARSHHIRLAPDSRIARALGAEAVIVNSIHHQGIKQLAPSLRPTGWDDDGLIEAAEGREDASWLLAVQWHPEEMHAQDAAPEARLFREFVRAAELAAELLNAELAKRAVG